MRKFRLVTILMVLAMALSGCADDGEDTDGDGTDGTDGGTGSGDGDAGNETEDDPPIPDPVSLTGNTALPDPSVTVNGCAGAAGGGTSGGEHDIEGEVNWTYVVTNSGYQVDFVNGDEVVEQDAGDEGTIPEDATHLIICTDDPNNAQSDYLVCLTPPRYEGDRATACG